MTRSQILGFVLALAGVVVLTACTPDPRDGLEPVPEPDLTHISEAAAKLFNEEQARLHALLAQDEPNREALVETFGRLGELAHAAERIDMAGACYRNAERLAPGDRRWPYYLGHLQHFTGNWEEGVKNFERALELRPNDQATLIHLGELYLDRNETGRAEELFSRAVELGDPTAVAQFGLGRVRAAEGNFAEAAKHFENTLARVPAASRVHYHLGVVYGRLGDSERAASHMAQQGPGLPRPADRLMDEVAELEDLIERRLGATAVLEGRLDDAMAELRAAEAADPEDPVAQLGLGTLLAREGDLEQAERHYRAALRLGSDRLMTQNASLNLGNLLADTDRPEEALAHYRTAIELDPEAQDADEARLQLVRTLMALGRPEEGEPHYRALFSTAPREPGLYLAMAGALAGLDRHAPARWVYERGREAHPKDARIANALARYLATCPDDEVRDGAEALRLASSLFSAAKSGPHAVTLAMALAENGHFEDAAKLQRVAVAEAERLGKAEFVVELRAHLRLYESGKPVRR